MFTTDLDSIMKEIDEQIVDAKKEVVEEMNKVAEQLKRMAKGIESDVIHISQNLIEQETKWLKAPIEKLSDLRKSKAIVTQCMFQLQLNTMKGEIK